MADRLIDFSSTGREKKWHDKKKNSFDMGDAFRRLGKFSYADGLYSCGDTLVFNECDNGHRSIKRGYFCKKRMCPYCMWRRSQKMADQVMKIVSVLQQLHKVEWIFVTLTLKNCKKDEIGDTLTRLNKAFDRLTKRRWLDKYTYGWFRSNEVTRNNEIYRFDKSSKDWLDNEFYDTYHPHIHALFAVKPSYFKKGYKSHSDWLGIWQECLQVDYVPGVHVEKVKYRKKKNEVQELNEFEEHDIFGVSNSVDVPAGIIAEVAKYTFKSKELFFDFNPITKESIPLYNEEVDDVVWALYSSLRSRKLYSFGKELNDIKKELKLAEYEDIDPDGALEHDELCKCKICQSDMKERLYSWIPKMGFYYAVDDLKLQSRILYHEEQKNDPRQGQVKRKYKTGHSDDDCDNH